jgi:hypothetical protein
MINKVIAAFVGISLLAMPATAQSHIRTDRYDHQFRGNDRRGLNTGEAIALGIGAAVLGSVLTRRSDRIDRSLPPTIDPYGYVDPYDIHRPRCIREQVVWRDAFGRMQRAFQYRCNR